MRIILLQDVKNLGKKFDIKDVADGYARNFLIPRGLAKIATDQVVKELKAQKIAQEKEEQQLKEQLENLAKELTEKEFHFYPAMGKKGEIFSSINKEDIKKQILSSLDHKRRECLENKIEINLKRPLKAIGEYEVEISLGYEIKTKIRVFLNQSIIQ